MNKNLLNDKALEFAVEIAKNYKYFYIFNRENVVAQQLLRSATSIGANINEACFAVSKADFISKMHIALKECAESLYWLQIINKLKQGENIESLINLCNEIKAILITSLNTAKKTN